MMEAVCNGKLEAKLVRQVQNGGRGSNGNQAAKYDHLLRSGSCYIDGKADTSTAENSTILIKRHPKHPRNT